MYKQYHEELQRSLQKLKNVKKKKKIDIFIRLKGEVCNFCLFERPNITHLAVYLNDLFENSKKRYTLPLGYHKKL